MKFVLFLFLVILPINLKAQNQVFSGNVGIGTSSFSDAGDAYRLSVKGKVRAHEVKVYTDWADFVFASSYKLPSLKDIETYIEKNGHLPDIPSASEIAQNGLEVGQMNKLLLQKIEELTLHMIQLNKELQELKSKHPNAAN